MTAVMGDYDGYLCGLNDLAGITATALIQQLEKRLIALCFKLQRSIRKEDIK